MWELEIQKLDRVALGVALDKSWREGGVTETGVGRRGDSFWEESG